MCSYIQRIECIRNRPMDTSTSPSPRPVDRWTPTYFLSSVGAGGLAVTFFMYLLFWVPHPGRTVPVFEDIAAAFAGGGIATKGMVAVAATGIAGLAAANIALLVWNLRRWAAFRRSPARDALRATNAEASTLALPLALAMSVNAGFILGLVFVPGLWGVVEYLFPLAMVAFVAIGTLTLAMLGRYLSRVLGAGGFDLKAHASFAQMLPAFALAMVAVGLSAPASMSTNPLTVGVALVLSVAFGTAAVLYALAMGLTGVHAMLAHGVNREAAPTLMIVVPLMTILSIMVLRQEHGLHTTFDVHVAPGETLVLLTQALAVQGLFLALGLAVLVRQGYAAAYLTGRENSPGSWALVCPGVALSVMLQFWLNKGLVAAGVVASGGVAYWAISALAVAVQVATLGLVLHLFRRHFGRMQAPVAVPAE
jgi:hypothetical protein